jgi:ribulose-phosphate 3-epimerase
MTQVIPTILAKDEQEFLAKLARVRGFAPMVHIDVMDGIFVPQKTWAPPEQMHHLLGGLPFEAHLMVSEPEHAVPVWLAAGASRVIFHAEASERESLIWRATDDRCSRLSLAINPETPISRLTADLECFRHVTVMAVTPGKSGQRFQEIAIEKVRALKELRPGLEIAVDGGVKPGNCAAIAAAGADFLMAGSAITDASDPEAAYREFLAVLEKAAAKRDAHEEK